MCENVTRVSENLTILVDHFGKKSLWAVIYDGSDRLLLVYISSSVCGVMYL